MLESMITNPTPTRAEVSDIAIAVREGTDAVMLSGETAYGKFPYKSVSVMATVAKRTENAMLTYQVQLYSNLFTLSVCQGMMMQVLHGLQWYLSSFSTWQSGVWSQL